jgi:hypothetical protein
MDKGFMFEAGKHYWVRTAHLFGWDLALHSSDSSFVIDGHKFYFEAGDITEFQPDPAEPGTPFDETKETIPVSTRGGIFHYFS